MHWRKPRINTLVKVLQRYIRHNLNPEQVKKIVRKPGPTSKGELQVVKTKQVAERRAKDLADLILFEKLLRTDAIIPLYDHKNARVKSKYWLLLLRMLIVYTIFHTMAYNNEIDDVTRLLCYVIQFVWPLLMFKKHYLFTRSFVSKVDYDTSTKMLRIIKYKPWFPSTREIIMPKNALMYISEPYLHKRFMNYVDVRNMDTFFIAFQPAWIDHKLFSYLIKQNIKRRAKTGKSSE